jgi:hypothetical protein
VKLLLAYSTEIGVEIIVRILLHPLTVSDSPNCVRLFPNFVKLPGRCTQAADSVADKTDRLEKEAQTDNEMENLTLNEI